MPSGFGNTYITPLLMSTLYPSYVVIWHWHRQHWVKFLIGASSQPWYKWDECTCLDWARRGMKPNQYYNSRIFCCGYIIIISVYSYYHLLSYPMSTPLFFCHPPWKYKKVDLCIIVSLYIYTYMILQLFCHASFCICICLLIHWQHTFS